MADVVISASDSLSLPPGFMTYVVEPLFAEWARFSDTRLSQTMLGHLGLNKASWSAMEPEVSGSSEEGESEPGRATEEPSSRALSQGSQESWHTSARRTPTALSQTSYITFELLATHLQPTTDDFSSFSFVRWFNLFNFKRSFTLQHGAIHRYLIWLLLQFWFLLIIVIYLFNLIFLLGVTNSTPMLD